MFEKIFANSRRSLHFHTQISSYVTKLNRATTDYILLRNEEKKKLIGNIESKLTLTNEFTTKDMPPQAKIATEDTVSQVLSEDLKTAPEATSPNEEAIEGDPSSNVLLGYKEAMSYTFLIATFLGHETDSVTD